MKAKNENQRTNVHSWHTERSYHWSNAFETYGLIIDVSHSEEYWVPGVPVDFLIPVTRKAFKVSLLTTHWILRRRLCPERNPKKSEKCVESVGTKQCSSRT